MRFSIISALLSLAAIATPLVGAQGAETNENAITKPAAGDVWVAGTPFPIEWTASANPGTVSIVLVKGVPGNLQVLETIAPNVANNGKFEWTPPVSLEGMQTMAADQVYQFKIVSDASGNFGFSPSFKIDSPGSTFVPTGAAGVSGGAATTTSTGVTSATSTSVTEVTTSTSVVSSVISTETSSEAATSTSVGGTSSESVTSTSVSETIAATSTSQALTTSGTPTTLSTSIRTSSTSTSEPTSATETPSSTKTSDASETTSSSPESSTPPASGIPVGAIAGITGGVIALIVLAIVGVFLFRRRKQQSRTKLRGETPPPEPSKYDRDFQMMERRARHRPTSSFGFNTSRSDTSGIEGRNDPYSPLDDRDSLRRGSETWGASRF